MFKRLLILLLFLIPSHSQAGVNVNDWYSNFLETVDGINRIRGGEGLTISRDRAVKEVLLVGYTEVTRLVKEGGDADLIGEWGQAFGNAYVVMESDEFPRLGAVSGRRWPWAQRFVTALGQAMVSYWGRSAPDQRRDWLGIQQGRRFRLLKWGMRHMERIEKEIDRVQAQRFKNFWDGFVDRAQIPPFEARSAANHRQVGMALFGLIILFGIIHPPIEYMDLNHFSRLASGLLINLPILTALRWSHVVDSGFPLFDRFSNLGRRIEFACSHRVQP